MRQVLILVRLLLYDCINAWCLDVVSFRCPHALDVGISYNLLASPYHGLLLGRSEQ